jgi:hypothetical protein
MKCPYCYNQMEIGRLQSPHELAWLKGLKRPFLNRSFLHRGSVILSKKSIMHGSAVKAFCCGTCQKVIIDYSDRRSDLNC